LKKLVILLIGLCLLLTGCGKETNEDIIKDLKNTINNVKSYKVIGNMEISNDEETFTYSLESYFLKKDYYKVILVNQTNNHEQIILKNKEDIYVITPALNKSFKFQSEWPNNSSQAYLIGNIVNDIEKDKNIEISKDENGYIIKSKVNYPNNEELIYQKVYLNNKKEIEKIEVYNDDDIIKIKVTFEDVDLKAGLKENDFKLDNYIKEEPSDSNNNNDSENINNEKNTPNNSQTENIENSTQETEQTCKNDESNVSCNQNNNLHDNMQTQNNSQNKEEETTNIENIIYPLYIPSNTYLTSSEKVTTNNGNRIILTFSGDKNFVLIEEAAFANSDMEIIPVYGEPLMMNESIGALSANSLSWNVDNISYYLASTELTVKEMQSIANSLGNSTLVSNIK